MLEGVVVWHMLRWLGAKKKKQLKYKGSGFVMMEVIKSLTPGPGDGAKHGPDRSGPTGPMSSGTSTPLPLGADGNKRSKNPAEKILSSSRYLAVTRHHLIESREGEEGAQWG